MPEYPALELPENPKLTHNITHFARALRKAGLPIGPGRVIDAIRAVEAAGFTEKRDFYWVLHACFVSRPEQARVFSQIFRLYWRDPRYMEHMMSMMLPAVRGVQEERAAQAAEKRAAEALLDGANHEVEQPEAGEEETQIEIDASMTISRAAESGSSSPRSPKSSLTSSMASGQTRVRPLVRIGSTASRT